MGKTKGRPSWLTFKQAMLFLGVSRATLYRWCAAEKIPHRWVGAQLRFVPAELERWTKRRQ